MKFKNKLKMRLGIAIVYVIIGVLLVVLTSIGIIKNNRCGFVNMHSVYLKVCKRYPQTPPTTRVILL